MTEPPAKLRLPVKNCGGSPLLLTVEPWGDQHAIPPGETAIVALSGPPPGEPAFEVGQNSVTVWGWVGSTCQIFAADGTPLRPEGGAPVPPIPAGMSMSQFIGLLFKGK